MRGVFQMQIVFIPLNDIPLLEPPLQLVPVQYRVFRCGLLKEKSHENPESTD